MIRQNGETGSWRRECDGVYYTFFFSLRLLNAPKPFELLYDVDVANRIMKE